MRHLLFACVLVFAGSSSSAQCELEAYADAFGQGTPGATGVPELRGTGGPVIDQWYSVRVLRGPGSALGLIFASLVEVEVAQPYFGGFQYVGAPYLVGTFALDSKGDSPALLAFMAAPALCGLTAVAQAALVDPSAQGGAALTNAVRVRLGIERGPLFDAQEYYGGSEPRYVTHGDLDSDGAVDLILAGGFSSDEVLVFHNRGDGTFDPGVAYPTFGATLEMAVADYDHDGHADVVVTNNNTDVIALLLGHGDGTLAPAVALPVGEDPRSVEAGDLDQDGDVDLAVVCNDAELIQILFGAGDGTFGPPQSFATGNGPLGIRIGDVNADGVPDLAVGTVSDPPGIHVRLGLGGGAFGPAIESELPMVQGVLVLGHMDGDGFLDAAYTVSGGVNVVLGQGDGTFALVEVHHTGAAALGLGLDDVNADGAVDLAVTNESDRNVSILVGVGDGSFTLLEKEPVVGSHPEGITMADLDSDGVVDFATANSADSLSVRVGVGDGTFRSGEVLTGGGGTDEIAIADFDHDGANDIVALSGGAFADDTASFAFGEGGGVFEDTLAVAIGDHPRSVTVSDFDGDGYPDACIGGNFVTKVFTGVHARDFSTGVEVPYAYWPLESADLDGNGTSDLVGGDPAGVSVALNLGGAAFAPTVSVPLFGKSAEGSALGDFNGDGVPDVASWMSPGLVTVGTRLLGLGDGTFGPASPIAIGPNPRDIATADLDQDGDLDLAAANYLAGYISIVRGKGDGTFSIPEKVEIESSTVENLTLGDVDHDGRVDVVTSQLFEIAVILAEGGGSFAEPVYFSGNGLPGPIAVGDLDSDGLLDLAVNTNGILVLSNQLLE